MLWSDLRAGRLGSSRLFRSVWGILLVDGFDLDKELLTFVRRKHIWPLKRGTWYMRRSDDGLYWVWLTMAWVQKSNCSSGRLWNSLYAINAVYGLLYTTSVFADCWLLALIIIIPGSVHDSPALLTPHNCFLQLRRYWHWVLIIVIDANRDWFFPLYCSRRFSAYAHTPNKPKLTMWRLRALSDPCPMASPYDQGCQVLANLVRVPSNAGKCGYTYGTAIDDRPHLNGIRVQPALPDRAYPVYRRPELAEDGLRW